MSDSEEDLFPSDQKPLLFQSLSDNEAQRDVSLDSSVTTKTSSCETEGIIMDNHKRNDQVTQNPLPKITLYMNILCHLGLLIITLIIVYKSFHKELRLFSWHPSFMTIGFFALMSEAILGFSDTNLIRKWGYKDLVFWHWLLQTIAGITIVIGFVTIFILKVQNDKYHFQSKHAIFGLIAVICTGITIAGGVVTKYGFQLRNIIKPIYSKIGHAIFGMFSFIFGLIAIILGFYTHWFTRKEDTSQLTCFLMTVMCVIIGIYVLYKPTVCLIIRIKSAYVNSNLIN